MRTAKDLEPETYPPLTDWENEPLVSDFRADFQDASSAHDAQESKINQWLDNLNITGTAAIPKTPNRSNIQPKLIRKQAEWKYAALSEAFLSPDKLITANPLTYEDKARAVQSEKVLNYQVDNHIDKVGFIDQYVRNAVNEGTSIIRVNWELEEEEVQVTRRTFGDSTVSNREDLEYLRRLVKLKVEDPNTFELQRSEEEKRAVHLTETTQVLTVPVVKGSEEVTETRITLNRPQILLENYRNVTIDPSCGSDYKKARFIIYSFETSMDELERAGRYTNLDRIRVTDTSIIEETDHDSTTPTDFNIRDEPRKRFVAYEYWGRWDIHNDGVTVPIVATYVGRVMIGLRENPYPKGIFPFVFVPNLPVKDSPYGEPDGALIDDNQRVIGAVTRGIIDAMARSANAQQGIRKDALDTPNRRKFNAGQDYEFNPTVDPRTAIINHSFPELPTSVQLVLQNQTLEAEALVGVRPFAGGQGGQGLGESATAVRSALDAGSKRELGLLRRLTKGLVETFEMVDMMNGLFLEESEIVKITNDPYVPVTDLENNYSLKIDVTSLEEDNQKAQELAFMLQTLGNSVDFGITQTILVEICRLRKMPVLGHKLANYAPEPDPTTQLMQQLELEKLKLENLKLESEIIEKRSKAQLDVAKTGTEVAKGRELNSKADLSNLDYVEQETGVTQARELQQHSQQANANIGLKLVEAALNRLPENSPSE